MKERGSATDTSGSDVGGWGVGHNESGSDLTALFTVMHPSLSYLKLYRLCVTCLSGQRVDLSHARVVSGRRAPSPFINPVLRSKPKSKIKPNSHRNTSKYTVHNVLCRGPEWGSWRFALCLVFWTDLSTWLYTLQWLQQVFLNGITSNVKPTWFRSWVMICESGLIAYDKLDLSFGCSRIKLL